MHVRVMAVKGILNDSILTHRLPLHDSLHNCEMFPARRSIHSPCWQANLEHNCKVETTTTTTTTTKTDCPHQLLATAVEAFSRRHWSQGQDECRSKANHNAPPVMCRTQCRSQGS
eukprot:6437525-Amphidinium_carterae.1